VWLIPNSNERVSVNAFESDTYKHKHVEMDNIGWRYSAGQQKSTKNINDVFLFKTQNKH